MFLILYWTGTDSYFAFEVQFVFEVGGGEQLRVKAPAFRHSGHDLIQVRYDRMMDVVGVDCAVGWHFVLV